MIRLLSGRDAPAFRDLRLLSLQTDPIAFLSSFEYESQFSIEFFQSRIVANTRLPHYGYFGNFDQDKLLGYIQLSPEFLPKLRHRANIYELYIHPEQRRRHLAEDLLNHIINVSKLDQSLELLLLHVNSFNQPAIKLYEKLNFVKVADIPQAVKEHDGYQHEYLYSLSLK
jgi:ribosomal protein S18 acetylase RimI-like enzyme